MWDGRRDIKGGKLLAELPGILLWAIEGWRRLNGRGHFVVPRSSRELVDPLPSRTSVAVDLRIH
jgi:phage/plasmid-associated DNA primase